MEKTKAEKIRGAIKGFARRYYWITALVIAAAAVFIIKKLVPTAYATDLDELKRKCDNIFTGFSTTNFEYMKLIYSAFKRFTLNDSENIMALYRVIRYIGILAVVVFTLMNVAKDSQRGDLTLEYFFRVISSLVVAGILVLQVNTFMDYLYGTGDYIVTAVYQNMKDDIYDASGSSASLSQKVTDNKDKILEAMSYIPGLNGDSSGSGTIKELYNLDKLADADWFQIETADSILDLMSYVVYAPMLICIVLISTEIFWVKVRQIFAPIAVAQCFEDGTRSAGIRYLKKLAATALTFAAIAGVAYAGGALQAAVIDNVLNEEIDVEVTQMYVPSSFQSYMGDVRTVKMATYNLDKESIENVFMSPSIALCIIAIKIGVIGAVLKASRLAEDIVGV